MCNTEVAALVLGYQEPDWTKRTVQCALDAGVAAVLVIPRLNGTGPMTPVFNRGMEVLGNFYPWVWHLTNVEFGKGALGKMLEVATDKTAAIHPVFNSDHTHLRGDKGNENGQDIPFVEWTAPLVRTAAWQDAGPLWDKLGYWGMDLEWSYRARQAGYNLQVCTTAALKHEYLRVKDKAEHPITRARRQIRAKSDKATEEALISVYGGDWMCTLWPCHPHLVRRDKRTLYV